MLIWWHKGGLATLKKELGNQQITIGLKMIGREEVDKKIPQDNFGVRKYNL